MTKIYIYALIDPRDNLIRYIGKTNNITRRLKEHLRNKNKTKVRDWIKSLQKQNLKPSIQIVDTATELDWIVKEQYWIGIFDNLLNMSNGGEYGCYTEYAANGINNGKSKLKVDNVLRIIELFRYTNLSCNDISKLFNVKETCVYYIVSGITWKSITGGIKTESLINKHKFKYNRKFNPIYV